MRRTGSYLGGHTLVPWSWFGKTKYPRRRLRADKADHDPTRDALVRKWMSAPHKRKKQLFDMILKYDRRHRRRSNLP